MTNLTRFEQDGIELVIDTTTGEAFATQSGYSRMSGISIKTLGNRLSRGFKGVHKSSLKYAEIHTNGGLQGVHLIPAEIVFDWSISDNPELARAMGVVGATVYMHKLAGYEVTSTAVPCPRFQTKNLYSHDVWRICYPDAKLPETTTLVVPTRKSDFVVDFSE